MAVRRIALLVFLALAFHGRAAAQAGTGSVRGHVYATPDRTPVAYALVRLAAVAGGAPVRTVLSDEHGAFAFVAVAPGTYRLQLERIGYASEQTEAFTVAADQAVERDFGSVPRAVAIRGIVATPVCRTVDNLRQDPALAALWNEVVKGLEMRRAFDEGYHYEFDAAEYMTTRRRRQERLDSLKWHITVDPRDRPNRVREGWGHVTGVMLHLEIPDGREILDPEFLRTHCIDGGVDDEAGVYTVGFRPVRARGSRVEVQGELRIDRTTLQVSTMEVEWWQGSRRLLDAKVEYADASVPGGTVRLAVGIVFSGTPRSGPVRGQVLFQNFSNLRKVEDAPQR